MTPDFRIFADSKDITAAIKQGLLSLKITDEAGISSDKVEITLDDRDGAIAMPRTGAKLEVSLGYEETSLSRMGLYVVDEVGVESPPQSMVIRGHAADMRMVLKAPRTRTWAEVRLGDVVKTIANEHGLVAKVPPELAEFQIPYLTQTEESDLHLLTRLAKNHGAITKPVHGNLLFALKGEAKSISGQLIPAISLQGKQITRWSANFAERGKYQSVKASWHNQDTATKETITIGEGEPAFTLRHSYDSSELAKENAKAALQRFERGKGTLRLSLPGNTNLMAEGILDVSGLRPSVDGTWHITRVQHDFSNSGYRCEVEAQTPTK